MFTCRVAATYDGMRNVLMRIIKDVKPYPNALERKPALNKAFIAPGLAAELEMTHKLSWLSTVQR